MSSLPIFFALFFHSVSVEKSPSTNKVGLITGSTSGIGKSIAQALIESGYTVFGTGRSVTTGSVDGGVHQVQMELSSKESVLRAFEYLSSKTDHLDLLINNAGRGMIGPIELSSDDEVNVLFEANVFGLLRVCRQALPILRNTPGSKIINISSIAGSIGLPFRGVYSASKFALEGISEALRTEMRPFDVHVCLIQPGDVKTEIAKRRVMANGVAGSVYEESMRTTLAQIDEEVDQAIVPEKVAQVVLRIARSRKPQFRYRVGKPLQIVSIALKRFLPYKMFEKLLNKFYNDKQ